DPVAQGGGALELHRLGGRRHVLGQLGLYLRRLALEETLGIRDERRVSCLVDEPDTGRAASLDLVEQARPRAAGEHRVRTVAEQKHLLQLVQRPVDRAGTGEGAVIVALLLLRTAMLLDLRERMF